VAPGSLKWAEQPARAIVGPVLDFGPPPPRVQPGDTVAVVSPSFGAPGAWPHRAERGRRYLESLGLKVRMMPHADRVDSWVSAPAQARADDLHAAFADESVAVVLSSIGGNHSNQVLPYLDYELIGSHPKIFQAYSDTTILAWAFARHTGLRSFYGLPLVLGMAEYPKVLDYSDRWLRAAWFGTEPLDFEASSEWTEEFLDFDTKADLRRARRMRPNDGWITLRAGTAEGPLVGGCLETICWHLKGSTEWLDLEGCILFLETSEEAPSPATVDAYLTDLELLGVFDDVSGLVMGRPAFYKEEDVSVLWDVVTQRTAAAALPALANLDIGHTDPLLTLPMGARAELDAGQRRLRVPDEVTALPRRTDS
jgi:muramoyltetrapeptide carboxypeptidase LdcA involved in peptidoglycan recycling